MKFYIWGLLAMSTLVAAMFFFRYWRTTRDRLFAFFSVAFALMALQWTASALSGTDEANHPYLLLLRLAAFLSILAAIMDKNRRDQRR
jgi:hypothetical protein